MFSPNTSDDDKQGVMEALNIFFVQGRNVLGWLLLTYGPLCVMVLAIYIF
jgi:hypothetical protein